MLVDKFKLTLSLHTDCTLLSFSLSLSLYLGKKLEIERRRRMKRERKVCLVSRAAQITIDDDSRDRMRRVRGREKEKDGMSEQWHSKHHWLQNHCWNDYHVRTNQGWVESKIPILIPGNVGEFLYLLNGKGNREYLGVRGSGSMRQVKIPEKGLHALATWWKGWQNRLIGLCPG